MPKILYFKGLPASGKSTEARKLVAQGWVRANKDDIRAMVHNSVWSRENEELVCRIEDQIIEEALKYGKNVVVDDTGFAAKNERRIRKIALRYNADFDVKFVDTDLKTCLTRNAEREGIARVPDEVIRTMYGKYIAHGKFVLEYPLTIDEIDEYRYSHTPGLPNAIMCDIDGTLALLGARSPYDWEKVKKDSICDEVAFVLDTIRDLSPANLVTTIMMSGRDEICRSLTEEWLEENSVRYDYLFMRPQGDTRKDSIVKRELFDAHIRGKYNIIAVFDDRPQVVRMWRELGLYVFECNQSGKEF